ncbi:Transposable element Tcb2 transposase [Araneus ventricosus]|uniref:Transposable element Tcb2 transposase n=1 Tax=Araneus ventricosus TaxID=182803 RepID=A0A4Y2TC31_ARAVE|nr:Transposable element Tcb2 transposase [Araneus ventricosus]
MQILYVKCVSLHVCVGGASRETGLKARVSVVCNLWKQFQDTGSIERKPGQGRPRATTATEDRYLSIIARRNMSATAFQLSHDLYAATGTRVSRVTVSKTLLETRLFARRPAVCVPLTSTHRRVRLAWCREHRDWSVDQWATVLFTDEFRFSLNTDSRRTFIWRKPGTSYLPSNVREIDHYGGRGLIVWAGIMLDGRTPLHVFERGTVTGVRYRDEILEPHVRLFRDAVGPEFILMDDNARPHRTLMVDEFLEREDIRRMDWPAKSPDLNPIEHVWDVLGRAIAIRNHPSENHPGNENSAAERVGPFATGNDKLPYFKYEVTLQGLYVCKRGPYPLLTNFFVYFATACS